MLWEMPVPNGKLRIMDGFDTLPSYDHLYSVSDLHLGGYTGYHAGEVRNYRVFDQGPALAWWISQIGEFAKCNPRTALVLNGDIVDFLAQENAKPFDPENCLPHLRSITTDDAFRPVWEKLQEFVKSKTGDLIIGLGNHDLELALPAVQNFLVQYLTGGDRSARAHLVFAMDGRGFRCRVGQAQVLCVHGNEVDDFNAVDHGSLGLVARALNFDDQVPKYTVNAGSTLVTTAMNTIKKRFQWIDLLKPEREAVIRVLGTLPRELFNELPLRQAISAALKIAALKRRDQKRIENHLLGVSHGTTDDLSLEEDVAARTAALLSTSRGSGSDSVDQMIGEIQRELGSGKRPVELLSNENVPAQGDEFLNIAGDFWAAVTNDIETKKRNLREALVEALSFDVMFAPTAAPDADLDKLDARIGTSIDFLLAGHTHFEKSLERKRAGTYYFNSGTWIRLINLQYMLEEQTFEKVWNILVDGSMECLDGQRGAPQFQKLRAGPINGSPLPTQQPLRLTHVARTFVHVRSVSDATTKQEGAPPGAVIGELLHVIDTPENDGSPFGIAAVENTRRVVNLRGTP